MISYTDPAYAEYLAAFAWGVDLERWYQLDRLARLNMIAVYNAKMATEAAEAQESRKKT